MSASMSGTWVLGDMPVRRMGLGAMRLTGTAAFHEGVPRDRDESIKVLRRAVELGVNHIDTAAFYFSSRLSANELINSALAPYPDDLVIATKVGPDRTPSGEWLPWPRPDQLRGQVEQNLRQLGRGHLDLVNLRMFSPRTSLSDHFGQLAELRQAGLIRHLGVSNASAAQLDEARGICEVVCVQNRYGLDSRRDEDDALLRICGQRGVAFVPFFAIAGQGRESGVTSDHSEQLWDVARGHDATPAQVRLAWTLRQGEHVLAIPGTGDLGHLVANVAAGGLRLSPDDVRRIEESVTDS